MATYVNAHRKLTQAVGATCLQVNNDVDTIGLVSPANIATPSIVFYVVQDSAKILPEHPRAD